MSRYTVSLTLPEVEELDHPEHSPMLAVEHFIYDVQDNPRGYVYEVTDDSTGKKYTVDFTEPTDLITKEVT